MLGNHNKKIKNQHQWIQVNKYEAVIINNIIIIININIINIMLDKFNGFFIYNLKSILFLLFSFFFLLHA